MIPIVIVLVCDTEQDLPSYVKLFSGEVEGAAIKKPSLSSTRYVR